MALALAAAAMMARHESGGGREGGSGSDRSDAVRRGTSVVTASALPRALCPVCRPMMPERALRPLGIPISRAYALNLWPKSRGAVAAEAASVRTPHTVGCVADMPCVSVCVRGGAARAARRAHRRLVNLVGFAFSVPKTTLTYRTNLC